MNLLIVGNFGNGNQGDEIVLLAMLQELRQLDPSAHINVVSGDPVATARMHGVGGIRRELSPKVVRAIADADVVIVGGGGILIDQIHSNLKYGLVILIARLFGKPVMVYAIGLDTITKLVARAVIRSSFNRAGVIALRDNESKVEMQKLGVTGSPIHVTADPAFVLDRPNRDDFREILTQAGIYDKRSPLVGISVWPADNLHSYRHVPHVFADFGDRLVEAYGCGLVFLVMSTIGSEGDLQASHQIVRMMAHRDRVRIFGARSSPQALMAAFGQMDIVIGMRYHSLVLSTIAQVPFVGIERAKYPKNTYLLREVRQVSAGMVENLTTEKLEACVATVWEHGWRMKRRLIVANEQLGARASRNIELLEQLVNGRGVRGRER